MSKKLYVGNLPFSVTQDTLKALFASYGEVTEATLVIDKYSGRSRGFGFVTLTDDAAADKAIAEMNGKDVEGRPLKVSEAKPMEPREGGRSGGGGGGGRRRGGHGGGGGGFGGGREDW
jgi:cold-inducible RNA-binding protein